MTSSPASGKGTTIYGQLLICREIGNMGTGTHSGRLPLLRDWTQAISSELPTDRPESQFNIKVFGWRIEPILSGVKRSDHMGEDGTR